MTDDVQRILDAMTPEERAEVEAAGKEIDRDIAFYDRAARLRVIRERYEASTPGEWFDNSYSLITADHWVEISDAEEVSEDEWKRCYVASVPATYGDTATGLHAADMIFIAHAHQDVPWLLAEVERLGGVEQRLASDLRELNQYHDEDTEAIGALRVEVERLERELRRKRQNAALDTIVDIGPRW